MWRAAGPAAQTLSRRVQEGLRRLGPGTPLPPGPRAVLERVLRLPLAGVRLHTGPQAAAVTGEIGAAAATVGRHIILAPTRTDTDSPRGLALLAHEAVHALQPAPAGEGTPTAREEEAAALQAEEQVRRALEPPAPRVSAPAAGTFAPVPLPLGRPGLVRRAEAAAAGERVPTPGTAPLPGPVRAVPAAGPLRRAPAEEAPPAAAAPPPAPAAQMGPAGAGTVDLEALAEEVLRRLRYRLDLERERRGL